MIDMRDVERWWEAIAHTRQSLFILDACLSGLGLQGKGDDLQARSIAELSRRGHHLITAGTADQDSFASMSRWGGSLFTTALIDGMSGNADATYSDTPEDGIVSLKELWDYVTKRIRSELPPETMTPQLGGFEFSSSGEFFFLASSGLATTTNQDGDVSNKGDDNRSSIEPEARETTIGSPQEDNQISDPQPESVSGRTLALTSEDVREIQGRLLSMGFDPEGIDGRIGERTRGAIMGWQAQNDFPQTGYLNFEQLLAVREQSSDTYNPTPTTVPSRSSTRQNVGTVTTQSAPNGVRTVRDGCMYEADGSLVIGFNPSNGC